MSSREHLGLRLSALALVILVSLLPRDRTGRPDRDALGVAPRTHVAVTTSAMADRDPPRPRQLSTMAPIAQHP